MNFMNSQAWSGYFVALLMVTFFASSFSSPDGAEIAYSSDVDPTGEYIVGSGKLAAIIPVFSFDKMLKAIEAKDKKLTLRVDVQKRVYIDEAEVAAIPNGTLEFRSWINANLITNPQSPDPESAGVRTAILGSLWTILITILVAIAAVVVGVCVYGTLPTTTVTLNCAKPDGTFPATAPTATSSPPRPPTGRPRPPGGRRWTALLARNCRRRTLICRKWMPKVCCIAA